MVLTRKQEASEMKNQKSVVSLIFIVLALACLQTTALGQGASQSSDGKAANVRSEGMGVRFDSTIPYTSATLTISAPDGTVYRREFAAGAVPSFALFDKAGAALGNGQYAYELRFTTAQARDPKERMAAPDDGIEDEQGRTSRKRSRVQSVVQSGSFTVQNGILHVSGETEPTAGRTSSTKGLERIPPQRSPGILSGNTLNRLRNHRMSLFSMPDQVIADDLIVQGSACIGLDCVNNENFGFDTLRLKENNTRIKFDDTSTLAGFPNHDWQLTANDSASGGANKFSIEDITAATVPFTITGSAPTNSIFVDSTGRVGLRTSTPVLDVHAVTGNTPAIRLDQSNSGGFTAQTWDIAGNESNFFVRDVTGGSRLPFRIRPGAPTSSIDISASGQVGVGTASPNSKLEVVAGSIADGVQVTGNLTGTLSPSFKLFDSSNARGFLGLAEGAGHFSSDAAPGDIVFQASTGKLLLQTGLGASSIAIRSGQVGIATATPSATLSVNGTANKPGGGSWDVFSDERLKNIKGRFNSGLSAVMRLQPIRYEYKQNNAMGLVSQGEHVGFGAQALQKVIPEAVTKNAEGYLMVNNDPILWTMLNAIKEQQKEIAELKAQVKNLRATSNRRRN
jgi:Chaperone of endosialidase